MYMLLNIKIKNYLWPFIALDIVSGVFAIVLLKILACILIYWLLFRVLKGIFHSNIYTV